MHRVQNDLERERKKGERRWLVLIASLVPILSLITTDIASAASFLLYHGSGSISVCI